MQGVHRGGQIYLDSLNCRDRWHCCKRNRSHLWRYAQCVICIYSWLFLMIFTLMKRLILCIDWQVQCLAKIVNETRSSLELGWKILTSVTVVGVRSVYRPKTAVIWGIFMEARNMCLENMTTYCRNFHQEALHISDVLQLTGFMENVISILKYTGHDNMNHSNF
jgi:hypothetical protein